MSNELNRIVIFEKNVRGDLSRCNVCNINTREKSSISPGSLQIHGNPEDLVIFTAIQPCIVCQLIIEKQQEVGRKLTKEEFEDLQKSLF